MRIPRTLAGGLLALALLGSSGISPADPVHARATGLAGARVADAGAATQARLPSHVVIHPLHHHKRYGAGFTISGQVRYNKQGTTFAAAGVKVTLLRRDKGASRWKRLGSDTTSHASRPRYSFGVKAAGNANYRVRFAGNSELGPSASQTRLFVHRRVPSKVIRQADTDLQFVGHVRPRYGHSRVVLYKRDCRACSWRRIRAQPTSGTSRFSFDVGAPRSGSWFFRVTVPASTRFAVSHSSTFRTFQP